MEEQYNPIDQLLHLLSPNHNMSAGVRLRDNYIFEAPLLGFFKLAYSEKRNGIMLFFARSVHDFDRFDRFGQNEHIWPIAGQKLGYKKASKWDRKNELDQHDVSWALDEISRFIRLAPGTFLGDATLHRHADNSWGSRALGYQSIPHDEKTSIIRIVTNISSHFRIFRIPPATVRPQEEVTVSMAKAIGRQLFKRVVPSVSNFNLSIREYMGDDQKPMIRNSFIKDAIIPTIQGDFVARLSALWHNAEPIKWRENHFMPLVRISGKLRDKIEEVTESFTHDRKKAITEGIISLAEIAIGGPIEWAGKFIVEKLSETAPREGANHMPRDWLHIFHAPGMLSVDSKICDLLFRPNEKFDDYFNDMAWMHPSRHLLNLTARNSLPVATELDDGFATWFRGQFFGPYSATMEYIADMNRLISIYELEEAKILRLNVPNGLQMYYIPETRVLYGYFHEPKLRIERENGALPQQHLPCEAQPYFVGHLDREGKAAKCIVRFNLSERSDSQATLVTFDEFAADIHRNLGAPEGERTTLQLLRPHNYVPPDTTVKPPQLKQRSPIWERVLENMAATPFIPM